MSVIRPTNSATTILPIHLMNVCHFAITFFATSYHLALSWILTPRLARFQRLQYDEESAVHLATPREVVCGTTVFIYIIKMLFYDPFSFFLFPARLMALVWGILWVESLLRSWRHLQN